MSDPTRTPPKPPAKPAEPAKPKPPVDAETAKRAAAAAYVVGQAGLKSAWKRGKEAAAARGITEEAVKQTVDRGRTVAMDQARKRGLTGQDLPKWPGGAAGRDQGTAGPSASRPPEPTAAAARPAATAGSQRVSAPPPSPPASARTPGVSRSMAGGAARAGLAGLAGLGRGRLFSGAQTNAARFDRRLAAFAIDLLAFAAVFIVAVIVLDLLVGVASGEGPGGSAEPLGLGFDDLAQVVTFRAIGDVGNGATIAAQILYLAAFVGYMIGAEARFGQTIGKRALHLRVVPKRRGAGPIGLQAALIRNLCRIYDILIPLWPLALFDLGMSVLTPSRQRSGDWFAGTVVLDERVGR